jgi:outer membrane protein
MTTRLLFAIGGSSLLLLAAASAVVAQTAAVPPIVHGPPITGMCVLSVNQAIATSAVGRYASQRMQQIVAQVKAELQPEDQAITTESRALQASQATLDKATLQSRAGALQTRLNAFQQKAALRQKEVQATEQKSVNRIAQELDPIARQLYQTHHCSVLFDRQGVMMANPAMDLTNEAVAGLNAKIQQFAFDREHLDTAATTPASR